MVAGVRTMSKRFSQAILFYLWSEASHWCLFDVCLFLFHLKVVLRLHICLLSTPMMKVGVSNASPPIAKFTLCDRASIASVLVTNPKDERQCFERLASDCQLTILPEGSIGLRGWEMTAIRALFCVPSALSSWNVARGNDRLLTFLVTSQVFFGVCSL